MQKLSDEELVDELLYKFNYSVPKCKDELLSRLSQGQAARKNLKELAKVIGDCLVSAGVINECSLTGPELILLGNDLKQFVSQGRKAIEAMEKVIETNKPEYSYCQMGEKIESIIEDYQQSKESEGGGRIGQGRGEQGAS